MVVNVHKPSGSEKNITALWEPNETKTLCEQNAEQMQRLAIYHFRIRASVIVQVLALRSVWATLCLHLSVYQMLGKQHSTH
jgi:hypothetical protein